MLAHLHSASLKVKADFEATPETILEVGPGGHEHFDSILFTALILERLHLETIPA
jgi:hypothetical protein